MSHAIPLSIESFEISFCIYFYNSYFNILMIKTIYKGVLNRVLQKFYIWVKRKLCFKRLVGRRKRDLYHWLQGNGFTDFFAPCLYMVYIFSRNKFYVWIYLCKRVFGFKGLLNQCVHTQTHPHTRDTHTHCVSFHCKDFYMCW